MGLPTQIGCFDHSRYQIFESNSEMKIYLRPFLGPNLFPIISVLVPEIKYISSQSLSFEKCQYLRSKLSMVENFRTDFATLEKMGTLLSAVIRRQLQTGFFERGMDPKPT